MPGKEPVVLSRKNEVPAYFSAGSESPLREDEALILKHARRRVDKRLFLWYSFVYFIVRIHVSNIVNTTIVNIVQSTGIKKQLGNLTTQ
jgi:hypothetical protein